MSDINFENITSSQTEGYKINKNTILVESARRHVIKINDITAKANVYVQETILKSRELITTPIKNIAIFCNEYIPEHFTDGEYIKYIFTINGIDYDVVPINSKSNGNKIIRTSEGNSTSDSVVYLSEDIKSAYLKIIITTPNKNETPYISNLKILVGG